MSTLTTSANGVNFLYADEWQPRAVGELAQRCLRSPGGVATILNGLRVTSYRPWGCNGERKVTARIWCLEDSSGNVLAEEPSLYLAIHQVAH